MIGFHFTDAFPTSNTSSRMSSELYNSDCRRFLLTTMGAVFVRKRIWVLYAANLRACNACCVHQLGILLDQSGICSIPYCHWNDDCTDRNPSSNWHQQTSPACILHQGSCFQKYFIFHVVFHGHFRVTSVGYIFKKTYAFHLSTGLN